MNYEKIYNQLIKRAKNRTIEDYTEKHHIIPRCLGGDDNLENLVNLTAREHFLAHWILCNIYPNDLKIKFAFVMMCNVRNNKQYRYTPSSRSFEHARKCMIEINKELGKRKVGKKYPKLSQSKKGYKFSNESKQKMSNSHKNLPQHLRDKINSAKQNMMWINNGISETLIYKYEIIPNGYQTGRVYSTNDELRKNHSIKMKGKFSGSNNPSAKSVYQYTLDGKFIKKYDTIKEAELETGIKKISMICNGKYNCNKFLFSFIKTQKMLI
jgi:hypothetical protein